MPVPIAADAIKRRLRRDVKDAFVVM